ncbi:hypothetical protein NAEGRDRAFT_36958 [Naegleria gruberi]|uniref:Cytoplasmic tRNA 2-thiolation protein 1 n=1 Tax=Naegleria gruberi TaxID=5762 RepID=D2VI75_NAEGR|nr:uncharacterized protein NAEGRDRAFT_36958 [Naegleria gruberi]EFC43548.1 hypothetical protein NAEGRDRAFT_36958 [Naegleria gruberi]|eukprot:XP_002676292.1 hypothetical protein NAEGRDRAFT_36958 [Naegleria gruberi strain NEG-M]
MPKPCANCNSRNAALKRPKNGALICRECFFDLFETEIHETIINNNLFKPGDKVAIAASGGKDSTALAHIMKVLNERYNYGLDLYLLSIDEGIKGYRDDSLETVKRNREQYQVPLKILSYKELYGWSMDEIVQQIGLKNNCTFCGVFRRQALDRGCEQLKVDKMVTGHNADDIAETVLMNILRGDIGRLERCVDIITHDEGGFSIPRAKPFKYTYQKEIVLYAYFKKLDYFSTECSYSPNAYRGHARELIKDLEQLRPQTIIDIVKSAEQFEFTNETISEDSTVKKRTLMNCVKCGYISSQELCRACVFLEGLNKGTARITLYSSHGQARAGREAMAKEIEQQSSSSSQTDAASTPQDKKPSQDKSLEW